MTSGQAPSPSSKLPTCEKELKEGLRSEENHLKQKADADAFEGGNQVPTQESRRTWQLWPCVSGCRVKDRRKTWWDLPLWLRKAAEARPVSGVSL